MLKHTLTSLNILDAITNIILNYHHTIPIHHLSLYLKKYNFQKLKYLTIELFIPINWSLKSYPILKYIYFKCILLL